MRLFVPPLPAAGGLAAHFPVAMFDPPLNGENAVAIGPLDAGPPETQRLHMIWDGHRTVVVDLGRVGAYNATLPASLAITPDEVAAQYAGRN